MSSDGFDISNAPHYVRVTGVRKNAFVEFDFSIDDPALFIELVLPFNQFKIFCERHSVQELTTEQKAQVDLEKLKWRYGDLDSGSSIKTVLKDE